MFSTVLSATLQGIRVEFVHVEADSGNGLPMFHMVGYLSAEVKEAGERVKTAIRNTGMKLQPKKIVVNLSPANVRKRGAAFDLPIAVAILASQGLVKTESLKGVLIIGELSLDGKIQKVAGILPIVGAAYREGYHTCIVPQYNASEGAIVKGMKVIGANSLVEVCTYLNQGETAIVENAFSDGVIKKKENFSEVNFSDIKGQEAVKRAAEVAAAGGHNLMFIGPPGAGKTMIAKRIPTILPKMDWEECIAVTKIYSVLGLIEQEHPLITRRPFREVHHTITKSALIGGGIVPVPGEMSLADKGVLFLDELAEFNRSVIEVLRQPLEEHIIRISRRGDTYLFPADCMLVAAMNPCPCGNYPDYNKCICTPYQVKLYQNKISRPFMDRMDICVETPKVEYEELKSEKNGESSKVIKARVEKARNTQKRRYAGMNIKTNQQLGIPELKKFCVLKYEEEQLMKRAFETFGLTARTYHKVLRVSRTIADIAGEKDIQMEHLREALSYRVRNEWGR